ncbi:Small auxin-up RNA [Trema orientale]|uniref:Small auxin-up RNA n=1 Tax=Trema orientale TaxID=63057 RepID=A0A2P5F7M2_TREOI|nr:Small auxin-up RNA [Trema orientale]
MGFHFPSIVHVKQLIKRPFSNTNDVPKGYLVEDDENRMKRFVIPVSYLNQPSFQELLSQAEEEFGFDYPMGPLTIPIRIDTFIDLVSYLDV